MVPLTAWIGALTSCDRADGIRVRSHLTKSGSGRMYSAPDAADMQSTDGVSGDGPARTHSTALFKLQSVAFEDPVGEDDFELYALGFGGDVGPKNGLGKEVVVCGWGVLSKWGKKLYSTVKSLALHVLSRE